MIEIISSIAVFMLGAVTGRIRGGLLKDSLPWVTTHMGRAAWALALGLVYYACSQRGDMVFLVILAAFIGTLHGYLGGYFDLALKRNRTVKNYAWLTLTSVLRIAPLTLVFWPTDTALIYPMVASLLFVPCYLAGNALYAKWPVMGHTQWGEFLIYGMILTAFYWGL